MFRLLAHAGHDHEPGVHPFLVIGLFILIVCIGGLFYYLATKSSPDNKTPKK